MLPTPHLPDRSLPDQGLDGPGDERPLGVVLTCCDCDTTYEPTGEDVATGRTGCTDPDCGGWVFSSALTEPATAGGAR